MLYTTVALFAIAAVIGLFLLKDWISKRTPSRVAVYIHGGIAATGLVLLLVYALQNPSNYPQASILLFVVAALGGFYLFYTDLIKKPAPNGVAVIHALVAVGAFVTLLLFVFG
jgi:FtsH-binding integral membrane protein